MAPKLKPIPDQTVVIVGAASGIGRQTALRFAEHGARLVLVARDETALGGVLDDVRARGAADAIAVPADVRRPEELAEVARRAREAFVTLDTWVHAAAVSLYATVEDTSPEEFRQVVEVNLLGPVHGALAALPALRASGGGAFIAISSVEAEVAFPYQAAYAASKHGLSGFLRALRVELASEGAPVAITQILPSGIDTPLFANARTKIGVAPRPAAPVYDPDVVADMVLHAAAHFSGDLYAGGGGWLLAILRRLSPGAVELGLVRFGKRGQRTDIPKSAAAPDNLDGPISSTDAVRGGFPGRRFSLGNAIQKVPGAIRLGAVLAAAGGTLMLLRRRAAQD